MIANVLSIAGADPSGGAGIQADLKAFSALGAYGTTVITALTAQNTQGVQSVHQPPAEFVTAQLDCLFADVRIDAAKTGMLGTAEVVRAVAAELQRHPVRYLVVDPVMVSTSGHRLLAAEAVDAVKSELLPLAHLITPNLPEAADLLGEAEVTDEAGMIDQIYRLGELCPGVLLKGGHLAGPESVDLLLLDGEVTRLRAPRVPTRNTHGSGCTLSAAITALRPQRVDWYSAVLEAKEYLTAAFLAADELDVGTGHGPQHHFHAWWPPAGTSEDRP